MIGQEIGLNYLIPLAIEQLAQNIFAEGDMYEGDLLTNVLDIDTEYWVNNKAEWLNLYEIINTRRTEINELRIKTDKFDNCNYK